MKFPTKLCLGAGLCLVVAVVITHATMGGQYSLNIHFVPPLVTGTCGLAQFWSPPNLPCALCFCITGTLSRCIPQPGCSPSNVTTNSTTPAPGGVTPSTVPTAANVQPSTETATVTPAPVTSAPAVAPPAQTPAPSPTAAPAPAQDAAAATTLPPAVANNFVRKRRATGRRIVRKTKDKF